MTGTLIADDPGHPRRPEFLEFDVADDMPPGRYGALPYISVLRASFLFEATNEGQPPDHTSYPEPKSSDDNELEAAQGGIANQEAL